MKQCQKSNLTLEETFLVGVRIKYQKNAQQPLFVTLPCVSASNNTSHLYSCLICMPISLISNFLSSTNFHYCFCVFCSQITLLLLLLRITFNFSSQCTATDLRKLN
ncbi:hypothetical protein RIF29_01964 [Crotalaria pallida]|uniref:Uncharacterized protein n=1 Tax=Crotalaria pallida TaxID=3830 RepID=A0AAN9J022_CROPI